MITGESTSLTLSQLLEQVGMSLQREFPSSMWIRAEILEFQVNQRGHCYLELIEKSQENDAITARARATIWASKFSMLKPYFESTTGMPLRSGIKILCRGNIGFHQVYGFSINITDIDPAYTLGDLARKEAGSDQQAQGGGSNGYEQGTSLPYRSSEHCSDFLRIGRRIRRLHGFNTCRQSAIQAVHKPVPVFHAGR